MSRDTERAAVHLAARITGSDPDSSPTPYALAAVGFVGTFGGLAYLLVTFGFTLTRRLGKLYSTVEATEAPTTEQISHVEHEDTKDERSSRAVGSGEDI